jgi:hypothetical protein
MECASLSPLSLSRPHRVPQSSQKFGQWGPVVPITDTQATPQSRKKFGLFALTGNNKPLEEGWINFHLLLWKYFIYQVTIVDTEEATYEEHAVWKAALQRFEFKAKAKSEAVKTDMLRADTTAGA